MNRIDRKFYELRRSNKKALIIYICAGDPDVRTSIQIALNLAKSGVDIIELGMPFSDPTADGATIQKASQRALKKGINVDKIFTIVKEIRKKSQTPIVVMGYYNTIFHYGGENFVKKAKACGVDGTIIADLPFEEAGSFNNLCSKHGIHNILFISPTTDTKRAKRISKKSKGFIYYVSLAGVTGARSVLGSNISRDVKAIKKFTKTPICVGFGISKPQHVKTIFKFADGAIIGSAVIKRIEKNIGNNKKIITAVDNFIKQLQGH